MGLFTPEELARLRAPFPLNAHTVREGHKEGGKVRWFVYIDRSAVQDLLDDMFPSEWETQKPELLATPRKVVKYDGTIEESVSVAATIGITIRGLTRWDGGESDDGSVKSALTNAFRRTAAYGWGIARYLYDMGEPIKTEGYSSKDANGKWQTDWKKKDAAEKDAWKQFEAWYFRKFGSQGAQNGAKTDATPSKATTPTNAQNGALSAGDITTIKEAFSYLSGDDFKAALNIQKWSDWTKGVRAAIDAISAWHADQISKEVTF